MQNRTTHRPYALLAAALLASCAAEDLRVAEPAPPEARTMTSAPETSARPPIDLRAPAHLETATFALG